VTIAWQGRSIASLAMSRTDMARVTTPIFSGGNMSLQSHIEALKERHASLDMRITEEDHRPRPDDGQIVRMKLEKLRLKDQMERLRTQSA
jgi:hypothetical protein